MADDRHKLELSLPQITGGALAAASAAVASSWLGLAGTVMGAVLVSLVVSIGGALYTHSLQRSSNAIRESLPVVPIRTVRSASRSEGAVGATTAVLPRVEEEPDAGKPTDSVPEHQRSRAIRWRTVLITAGASLVLGLGVLTGFELLVGKPASSIVNGNNGGGTTVSRLVSSGQPSNDNPSPADQSPPPGSATTDAPQGSTGGSTSPEPTEPTQPAPTDEQPTPTDPTPTDPTEPTPTDPEPTGATPSQPDSGQAPEGVTEAPTSGAPAV
jgi:hypothetical protein